VESNSAVQQSLAPRTQSQFQRKMTKNIYIASALLFIYIIIIIICFLFILDNEKCET
jgi:hypothetical protein